MKSTIHEFQKNNSLSVSKNLIITGIALLVLNQVSAGRFRSAENEQGESLQTNLLVTTEKHYAPVEDQTIFNPSLVLVTNNDRSIEEIIAENKRITESSPENDGNLLYIEKSIEAIIVSDNKIIEAPVAEEIHLLYLDRTIEDKIAEDNAIIESTMTEAQPLNAETKSEKPLELKKDGNQFMG